MSDTLRRKKERDARAYGETDVDAQRAERARRRYDDPYSELIGLWVLYHGVREHYRGLLTGVSYYSGGARFFFEGTVYHMANFDQESPNLDEGEMPLPGPQVLLESACIRLGPQLPAWPKGAVVGAGARA